MRVAQIVRYGEPVEFEYAEVADPVAGPDEVVVHVEVAGVNFHDLNVAANAYGQNVPLPHVLGSEVVGRLEDGSRVIGLTTEGGGFAERVAIARDAVYPMVEGVSDLQALTMAIQGNTAWQALHTLGRLRRGETVLVLGGAGGVGMLAIQLARIAGAGQIIAAVSAESKHDLVRELGADHVVDSSAPNLAAVLNDVTEGSGVDVVIDNIGGRAWDGAIESARPLARLVSIGKASGHSPTPFDPRALSRRNLLVTGMYLGSFPTTSLQLGMQELLRLCSAGELRVMEGGRYSFDDVATAVNGLRTRSQGGKLIVNVAGD